MTLSLVKSQVNPDLLSIQIEISSKVGTGPVWTNTILSLSRRKKIVALAFWRIGAGANLASLRIENPLKKGKYILSIYNIAECNFLLREIIIIDRANEEV